jgi:type III pantothenate kinase
MSLKLICLDVGNTTIHSGCFVEDRFLMQQSLSTEEVIREPVQLDALIEKLAPAEKGPWDASFCSVSPKVNEHLEKALSRRVETIFQLTSSTCSAVTITHPKPSEIGADRIANAIAAQAHHGTPAIVIDLGTATTFDVIGSRTGYEGGIIAPGLAVMTNYLAERTALLPRLEPDLTLPKSFIGRSTKEAMQVACSVGFPAMINGILQPAQAELAKKEGKSPVVIATGGTALELNKAMKTNWTIDLVLTLRGLVEAFRFHHDRH